VAAKRVEVIGGKKFALALDAMANKITDGGALKVGFLADRSYPGAPGRPSLPVAAVAFWNEFGTSRAPPRPFFRTTIARESKKWGEQLSKAIVYYKYDGRKALSALGLSMADDITASIQRWTTPPNAPYTVRRKGFNKPLIHTRVLVDSPDFELSK
jgi:hypothetical protein